MDSPIAPSTDLSDRPDTPARAWQALQAGNARFVNGTSMKADQDGARRHEITDAQRPYALIFGCSDSRVAAEIVFDQGLGHLFVVRTAGHVVDSGVLGSIEIGVAALSIPLVIVLGHDRCGAMTVAMQTVESGIPPAGFIRDIIERITPSVLAAQCNHQNRSSESHSADSSEDSSEGTGPELTADLVGAEHVRQTVQLLVGRSAVLADAVKRGSCAIVGLVYNLRDGEVKMVTEPSPAIK